MVARGPQRAYGKGFDRSEAEQGGGGLSAQTPSRDGAGWRGA